MQMSNSLHGWGCGGSYDTTTGSTGTRSVGQSSRLWPQAVCGGDRPTHFRVTPRNFCLSALLPTKAPGAGRFFCPAPGFAIGRVACAAGFGGATRGLLVAAVVRRPCTPRFGWRLDPPLASLSASESPSILSSSHDDDSSDTAGLVPATLRAGSLTAATAAGACRERLRCPPAPATASPRREPAGGSFVLLSGAAAASCLRFIGEGAVPGLQPGALAARVTGLPFMGSS